MKLKPLIAICLFVLVACQFVVATEQISPYGGVLMNYTNMSGGNEIQTRVNIPLTVEDVAYPDWLFMLLLCTGLAFTIIGILLVARSESIPSAPITFCGIFAFGTFAVCAVMAPLVATIKTNTDIVVSCNGTNAVYVEQIVTYLFSPWVGWACWGGALAGFVLFVAGVLSYFGWLSRKGIGSAQKGDYLETEGDEEPEQIYKIR